jgi:hypothetical protein
MKLSLYCMVLSAAYACRPHIKFNWWVSFFMAACGVAAFITTALATPDCPTLQEARAKYPTAHLWKSRGCWGTMKDRAIVRKKKVAAPLPKVAPPVAEHKAEAVLDANGTQPTDKFDTFRERFVTFTIVQPVGKSDRLAFADPLFAPDPTPLESDVVPLPTPAPKKAAPSAGAWLALFVLIGLAAALSLLGLLPPGRRSSIMGVWRKINVTARNIAARFADKPAPRRERKIAGSTGAGNQQPHLHSRDFYDWSGGTYFRGHADRPHPFADCRDNTGALGAWARSRGLRPETPASEPGAVEIEHRGEDRKRVAKAWWR